MDINTLIQNSQDSQSPIKKECEVLLEAINNGLLIVEDISFPTPGRIDIRPTHGNRTADFLVSRGYRELGWAYEWDHFTNDSLITDEQFVNEVNEVRNVMQRISQKVLECGGRIITL